MAGSTLRALRFLALEMLGALSRLRKTVPAEALAMPEAPSKSVHSGHYCFFFQNSQQLEPGSSFFHLRFFGLRWWCWVAEHCAGKFCLAQTLVMLERRSLQATKPVRELQNQAGSPRHEKNLAAAKQLIAELPASQRWHKDAAIPMPFQAAALSREGLAHMGPYI